MQLNRSATTLLSVMEMPSSEFEQIGRDIIAPLVAELIFYIGLVAKYTLDIPLSEVLRMNMNKVSGRVAAGLVDKSDGERPAMLL